MIWYLTRTTATADVVSSTHMRNIKSCNMSDIVTYWAATIRAGSVSVFGVSIGIRYFRLYFFHVGSVFGIGIGISVILVENRKFLVPNLYLAPLLRVTCRNFTVGSPFGKLEWWGNQLAMKKLDSKFGRFDTSTWQTHGHRTTAKTRMLWTHYVVLIVFCYTLLMFDPS